MTDPSLGEKCAVYYCRAVLLPNESVICKDCMGIVKPLIRAAVQAETERCAEVVEALYPGPLLSAITSKMAATIRAPR